MDAPVPPNPTAANLRHAIDGCRACDLWKGATQPVLGEGPAPARVMFVGEQPGDREDLAGHPFVGPAGRVLDQGMAEAGLAREDVFLTNVVKHFRFKARGNRRIHQRPDRWQVKACLPWLEAELEFVSPEVLVCLGAVAAQALLGPSVRVGRDRGRQLDSDLAERVLLTTHPSSILRAPDAEARATAMAAFVSDLRTAASWLSS